MPTAAWTGFLHSWHTLGIVLKWMCITVVGIPVAIATCVVVAAAVLLFAALCLAVVAGAGAGLFYVGKGVWLVATRLPYWIDEFRIHRAERKLWSLPISEKRSFVRWPRERGGKKKVGEAVPRGYMPEARPSIILTQPLTVEQQLQLLAQLDQQNEQAQLQELETAHTAVATPTSPSDDGEESDSKATPEPPRPVTPLPELKECQVCLEPRLQENFPSRKPTKDCDHEATDCCTACLTVAIITAFESNIWDDIRCPICNLKLGHQDVAELAPKEIFERYDQLSLNQVLQTHLPNFRWCLNPLCNFGQEHPSIPPPISPPSDSAMTPSQPSTSLSPPSSISWLPTLHLKRPRFLSPALRKHPQPPPQPSPNLLPTTEPSIPPLLQTPQPLQNQKLTCSLCTNSICAHHNVPWHSGLTCPQFDRRTQGAEKKSERIIKKVAKRCPGCRRWINKNGGCWHMSCVCGKEFCWNCYHSYPGHTWGCAKR